ncbi:hypothetical protein ACWC6I_30250 [Streptomyces sp. NPDC001414]|uniref:hypothetical protein n=1 Tax=unclassified Streptomyces TaxID=2593676 RepID=UPI0037FDFDB7
MRGRTAWAAAGGAAALVLTTATGAHAEGRGDIRVVKTVVNGGGNVIVGTSKTIRYPVDIKKGAAHYSTVSTATTGEAGKLSTKVTVTSAGSWRWYFPGTTTTSLKVSTGDVLDLA